MSLEESSRNWSPSERVSPAESKEKYLREEAHEVRDSTIRSKNTRLKFFVRWCKANGIKYVDELNGRHFFRFRQWRQENGKKDELSIDTLESNMAEVRRLIRFCERLGAVRPALGEDVPVPDVEGTHSSETVLEEERAEAILEWLNKYQYATIDHVIWLLTCRTGLRLGSLQAIDVGDYNPDAAFPHIDLRDRPETRLKNGRKSERMVGIPDDVCAVLNDYLSDQRHEVLDKHGRKPFLSSRYGRRAGSTIRKSMYKWSRPCKYGEECPHGRDTDECDYLPADEASKCESSVSGHPVRRGYITDELRSGTPMSLISERCDVSEQILEDHYDVRTKKEKMADRQRKLEEIHHKK